ncbi:gamma-glutamyltransferase family protein [Microbacterium oleivorans]|uniref:Gamma-glutamyltransferase n=1 Tax=Microbacterium oleivorans TaxID=273677 RepID=A0A7D5IUL1_9MICO|nr:gamma-glutamyltransferase [Microbacterium oleivorans]QLD13157.1 gamma-glutamyltransferase [Microbacterium oleivorans]
MTGAFPVPSGTATRPLLTGTFGMAASTHWLATASAQAVLERGGNAFDAVVAGGFVLQVVEPHLNGPGGDLVGLFQGTRDAHPRVLMGQGPAPAGASIEHFRAEGLDLVPGAGALAAAVPGAVDAWLVLLRDYGTWELSEVLAYAIGYARDGHPLLAAAAATVARVASLFSQSWPTSADLWLRDGAPPRAGDLHRNPALAGIYEGLVAAGADQPDRSSRIEAARREWKTGLVARAASAFAARPHRHATGGDHAGIIAEADFAGFSAGYEEPLTCSFRGRTIVKAGAWTQGPLLLQTLSMLDPLPDEMLDPGTGDGAHTLLEALKLALADRDGHFGDGADIADLLAPDYIASRRALIEERASRTWRPGSPGGRAAHHPPRREPDGTVAAGTGEPTVAPTGRTRGDTCHIDVVDRWGNIVAVTPSGGWLQSSPTIPELGFALGTRLQMCWLDPASPAALRPGARPRTTLSPTLVMSGDRADIALGTPGGDQQDQWQLPMLLRMLVGGWDAQTAIDAPTLHTIAMIDSFWPRTWTPAGVVVEGRIGDDVIEHLAARGHDVVRAGDWSLGRLSAVGIDRERGTLWAAANPRGLQGYAAGR